MIQIFLYKSRESSMILCLRKMLFMSYTIYYGIKTKTYPRCFGLPILNDTKIVWFIDSSKLHACCEFHWNSTKYAIVATLVTILDG